MNEIKWTTLLETQQEYFIARLKSNLPNFFIKPYDFCELINLELFVEKRIEIDDFCWELTQKYREPYEDEPDEFEDRDKFMNYQIGKLGEEAVKSYLGGLISSVDYKIHEYGDGGVDFFLKSNPSVTLQVKTTCLERITHRGIMKYQAYEDDILEVEIKYFDNPTNCDNLDKIKWQISEKEKSKNQLAVFVILLNFVWPDEIRCWSKCRDICYNFIIAGFKPTDLLNADSNIYLKDIFYSGGLRGYLKCLMKN